jgi:hypothetical protein
MKKIILFLFPVAVIACSPSNRISVTNMNDLASYGNSNNIYSLPLTRVAIDVTAVRHLLIPGPYNAYAQKYLGLDNVPSISKTDWDVVDIQLRTIEEPDPEFCYSIRSYRHENTLKQLDKLMADDLIISPYTYYSFTQFYPLMVDNPEPLHFTDLSVKRNIDIDMHKSKDKKETDSGSAEFSQIKGKDGMKSLEQRAEEAANFIIKIRKRRFKLLAGIDNVSVDQLSIETSDRELDALEANYLSLFIGKTYTDTLRKTFLYNPQVNQDMERNVFCRFSDETGFQDAIGSSGMPMVLELKNMHTTEAINKAQMPSSGPTFSNILIYRIPDKATVRIFYGSSTIMEGEIKIFQYGPMVATPVWPAE